MEGVLFFNYIENIQEKIVFGGQSLNFWSNNSSQSKVNIYLSLTEINASVPMFFHVCGFHNYEVQYFFTWFKISVCTRN